MTKRWSALEGSRRNFASRFGRKAFIDLGECDFVKAKHADNFQDLLDRPCKRLRGFVWKKWKSNELACLLGHGWYVQCNKDRDIAVMLRTNLAGSTLKLKPELHQTLPLSDWIVEIRFGNSPTQAIIRKMGTHLSHRFDRNHMEDDMERCGVTVFRICAFHRSAKVASKRPARVREVLGIVLADCFRFHYQVNIIAGDADMAAYRASGSRQGSTSIRDSCFQEMVRYYLRAYAAAQCGDPYCCPKARFVTASPLALLRWMEDKFGVPWKNLGAVDWQNAPSLHCVVACVMKWSCVVSMEKWSNTTTPSTRLVSRNASQQP